MKIKSKRCLLLCLSIIVKVIYSEQLLEDASIERQAKRLQFIQSCEENHGGTCMLRSECQNRQGAIGNQCFLPFMFCCTFDQKCGDTVSKKVFYFTNEENPKSECSLHIKSANRRICQLRIDFETFSLSQPTPGSNKRAYSCITDTFTVTTNTQFLPKIPVLCGENSGQHMYIRVKPTTQDPIATLSVKLADRTNSANLVVPHWKMKITQLECPIGPSTNNNNRALSFTSRHKQNKLPSSADNIAPDGCLQYYQEREGTYKVFNYNEGNGPYIGELDYIVCFQRNQTVCGIKHTPVSFQMGYNNDAMMFTERDCDTQVGTNTYIEDYLYIPNGKTQTGLHASKYCNNAMKPDDTVTSLIPGPLYVYVKTGSYISDVANTQKGFQIKYNIVETGC